MTAHRKTASPKTSIKRKLARLQGKIGWTVIAFIGLAVLVVAVRPALEHVFSDDTNIRLARWLRERGIPDYFIPRTSEDRTFTVPIVANGWGSLALAFDQVAREGKKWLDIEPPDLKDVRVCRAETVVRRTHEEVLAELLSRYPKCFAAPHATGEKIQIRASPGAPLVRTTDGRIRAVWCDCPAEVIARTGHK